MSVDLYRCTPRQTRRFITEVIEAGLVPFVISSPGVGKSSLFRSVAKSFNLELIDHRLSTSPPEDLNGLPKFITTPDGRNIATFQPFDIFPCQNTPIPKDKDGWMVFFDEFNSAQKATMAACYKTILDRMVGQTRLHDNVVMGCAGNLMTDRAITNSLPTAMQSRMVHIEMVHDFKEWYEDVAVPQNYDERIIAYLNYDNDELMNFRPDHTERTFNCPRTWEFMNKVIWGKDVTDDRIPMYAGTISAASAMKFAQFVKIYDNLIGIKDVLADPEGANVPMNQPERSWAIVSHLLGKTTADNFDQVATYIDRFDLSFRIMFYRGLIIKHPKLRTHPAYAKAMISLNRYLLDA